jgi:hypothetical protein
MENRLYVFKPKGHGELSFFVIAETETQAREIIDLHIKENYTKKDGSLSYEVSGWGTDYYELTIAEQGQVITNNND